MNTITVGQPQHIADAAAAALVAVFDVAGYFMHAGIQLDAVRSQDHDPIGRHLDPVLLYQMVAYFDEGLLYFTARDIKYPA